MIQCKCGNMMMMEPGEPNYAQKDEKGQQLTPEAAEHLATFRIYCHAC